MYSSGEPSLDINDARTVTPLRWGPLQLLLTLLACIAGWSFVAALCLCVGSTGRGFGWPASDLLDLRGEHVLVASLIGAALAAAGVVYQAILRNPLADPYLLGVSSGASLASFLWRLAGASVFNALASVAGQQMFAFAGALVSMAVVLLLANRRGRLEPITLLLVGVIVNAINGSLFLLFNTLKRDITGGSGGPMSFLVGGIQTNLTGAQEYTAAAVVLVGLILLMLISGELNVAALSEAEATALGVRIHRLRWIGLGVASLVTATVVAISGPIGFVGLICPHVARRFVGTDQRRLLPVSTAMGAALLALADAASRLLSNPGMTGTILPVGVLTGLLGGPFFLMLLWQSRRSGERAVY